MNLWLDFEALLWFLVYLIIALFCAYTVGFLLFYKVCRLDPSSAIRFSITISLVSLLILLLFSSSIHAPYLAILTDITLIPNLLMVLTPIIGIIVAAWVVRPKEIN